MVINNTATANGDVIEFSTEVPIIGLVALLSFTSDTENETLTDYFVKSFQYAVDGINFSPWQELTTENVLAINPIPTKPFKANYRYQRVGSGTTPLIFDDVRLNGTIVDVDCGPYFKRSVFAENFSCTDPEAIGWALNVCEKIYRGNVMSSYIDRDQNQEMYVAYIYSMILLFAYIVKQLRISTDLSRPKVARFYLENYGNIVGEHQTQEQIIHILSNIWKDFFNRGTNQIFERGDVPGSPGATRIVDGEFLRLLENSADDYFLAASIDYNWILGKTSPTSYNVGSANLSQNPYLEDLFELSNQSQLLIFDVNEDLDYLLRFDITADCAEFSIFADDDGVTDSSLEAVGANTYGSFIFGRDVDFSSKTFRMKVYSQNFIGSDPNLICNIPNSGNLKFSRPSKKLNVVISVQGGDAVISNIRFYPAKTKRSKNKNIAIFAKNNSSKTEDDILDIARKLLLPIGTNIKLNLV